jgi:small-conductance mechanosensitive channel
VAASWKKQFVYGLISVLIVARSMEVLSIPIPLFRLFTFSAALISLAFCLRLAGQVVRQDHPRYFAWALRLNSLFLGAVVVAELWGHKALASHVFISLIRSIATALVFALFLYIARGGLEWLFRSSPLRRASMLDDDATEAIIRRLGHFLDVVIVSLILIPAVLMIWGVYDTLQEATEGLLGLGFGLGSHRITIGLVILSTGILYASFLASWIVQKLLVDEVFFKRRVERGVRLSIARLAHYAIMVAGLLAAISALGFEIGKITLMLSALGVGIGFGLQSIVNNFVSGLILLFERPVRVGDYIEIAGGKWAEIKHIGIRATTVLTFDRANQIIPNADLVSNQVTNWTLSNRQIRLILPVGVAYGSDVPLVMETLVNCADAVPNVASSPSPQVLFLSFGESTLDFELRLFVNDADNRLKVRSELNQEIDRRFREKGIEIAFPQRDLHLRSVDEPMIAKTKETSG